LVDTREIDLEDSPFADFAVHPNISATLTLPLISFETGRRAQTQSSVQDHSAGPRQQMEAWFLYRQALLRKRVGRAFALFTKTYHRSRITGHLPCPIPLVPQEPLPGTRFADIHRNPRCLGHFALYNRGPMRGVGDI
jgi:hypothetical protein